MWDQAIIGALFAGIALLASKLIDWYKERKSSHLSTKKQDAEADLAANQQALTIYKEIVEKIIDGLKKDIDKFMEHQHTQDEQHLKCREENIMLKNEITLLKSEIATLRERIQILEKTTSGQLTNR